ncbi:MAG: GAF domain-containing protein [Bacteroidetes bacterium]|nr:GAF domain-containing protein [Bacteroidota bacterium]
MKIKLSIGRKLSLGFTILIGFFLFSNIFTFSVFRESQRINDQNSNVYVPSMLLLMEFNNMIITSERLIGNWIFIQSDIDTQDKNQLKAIIAQDYIDIKSKLVRISENWDLEMQEKLEEIFSDVDLLFVTHKYVMDELADWTSYDDPMILFFVRPMMEEGGDIAMMTRKITNQLDELIDIQNQNVELGYKQMNDSLDSLGRLTIILTLLLIISGALIAYFSIKSITNPVNKLRVALQLMGQGKIPETAVYVTNDEIGEMAKALNFLVDGLKDKSSFSVEIGQGNFASDFKPLSEEDDLGLALLDMRESLKNAKEEENKRRIEDDKRSWATHGIAKFAELLRQNNDNIQELSFSIIKNLVKYLDANQGGIFIVNDEEIGEKSVDIKACFAYDKKKFLKKTIYIGEGLVGTCLQEGESIFLTDVPDTYVNITSGLGDSNPRCILIVPLKLNDEIFGVIEIASFKIMESYQIEFVERIAESIAATISTVKINIRTTELLHQSQEQSEEMRAQEEEMRQNMEEMHATQEEMERKEIESQSFYEAINESVALVEISMDGNVRRVNKKVCDILLFSEGELSGHSHVKFFDKYFVETSTYHQMWSDLTNGQKFDGTISLIKRNGTKLSAQVAIHSIKNKYREPVKIIFIIREYSEVHA